MSPRAEQIGVKSDAVQNDRFIKSALLEAKKLNDAKWIYGLYGAMDGLSTSFSMLKYFFDMYYTSNHSSSSSSDILRNWSLTPFGIAFMAIESVLLIGCGVIGNIADDDGYSLHLMSLDEAKKLNHVNCFIWDENQLVYISPEGEETIFNRDGDVVNLALIKKLKAKQATEKKLSLSIAQANDLLLLQASPYSRAQPTPTLVGLIASHWGYARDVMKAMKNSYKGTRNTFVLTDLLIKGHEYHYLAVPIGLAVGVIAACNRTWLRKIREERKDAKKLNLGWLEKLLESTCENNTASSLADWDLLHDRMLAHQARIKNEIQPSSSHSQFFWLYAQLSAALSGLVDAPYLYFGALSLVAAAATSPFFIFVATASFIFAAVCIATRVYEEQNFQRELLVTQFELELVMSMQKIQLLNSEKRFINDALALIENSDQIDLEEKEKLEQRLVELDNTIRDYWRECQLIHKKFLHQAIFSPGFIFMSGLKNGLDTYGALASLMFLIATISLVIVVPYAQFLVLSFVTAGLAALIIFPALALIQHYCFQEKKGAGNDAGPDGKPSSLEVFSTLEREIEGTNRVQMDPSSPVCFYDSVLEMGRGACSGAGKGIRGVEQVMAGAQALGADGHYHDTDSMWIFAWIDAILFAITFGLRGFARWGRGANPAGKPGKEKPESDSGNPEAEKPETELMSQVEAADMLVEPEDENTLAMPSNVSPSPSPLPRYEPQISPGTVTASLSSHDLYQSGVSMYSSSGPGLFKPALPVLPLAVIAQNSHIAPDSNMDHYTF